MAGPDPLTDGPHELLVQYDHDGGFGTGGEVTLSVDGEIVDSGRIERTVPIVFSMSGETFDVGVDTGAPVGDYPHGFAFTGGQVIDVTLERLVDPDTTTRQAMRDGETQAALRSQ